MKKYIKWFLSCLRWLFVDNMIITDIVLVPVLIFSFYNPDIDCDMFQSLLDGIIMVCALLYVIIYKKKKQAQKVQQQEENSESFGESSQK